nr:uncharacterized protein LOC112723355 isoform X4 [Arachis hypogaea]XP_029146187.1 uncharacterized protein LOC112723355 isoform X4 [Arachis hypogaea]
MFQFLSSNPSFFPLFLFLFLSSAASTSPMHHLPDESVETNETVLNKHGNGGNTSTTLLLAPHRTNRPDIFNHFQPYTAGWNLTNYHYLSSVISSAVPLIVAAVAWLVVFGVCLQLICFCYCCCPSSTPPPHAYSKSAYVSSFIFLFLFTIAAIGGCLILYSGQGKLHESTSQTLHFLVNQAHLTALNLREVSDYFDTTKQEIGSYHCFCCYALCYICWVLMFLTWDTVPCILPSSYWMDSSCMYLHTLCWISVSS